MSTINDVAKLAGVAKGTVSKVINNYPGVSPLTQKKVQEAISELAYVPSQLAIQLSKKSIKKIGVILQTNYSETAIDEITLQFIYGVNNRALEADFDLTLFFYNQFINYEKQELIAYFQAHNFEGIIIFGLSKDDTLLIELINSNALKIVTIDAYYPSITTSCITINNYQAQYEIAKKYINKYQKTKILYLSGKENSYVSELREKAIIDLAKEKNLEITFVRTDFNETLAYDVVSKNYAKHEMIICASDNEAIGAKRFLRNLTMFIPIIGFDGLKLLRYVGSDIPTVKQDFYKMSQTAVNELIRLINGGSGQKIEIPYKIGTIHDLEKE